MLSFLKNFGNPCPFMRVFFLVMTLVAASIRITTRCRRCRAQWVERRPRQLSWPRSPAHRARRLPLLPWEQLHLLQRFPWVRLPSTLQEQEPPRHPPPKRYPARRPPKPSAPWNVSPSSPTTINGPPRASPSIPTILTYPPRLPWKCRNAPGRIA